MVTIAKILSFVRAVTNGAKISNVKIDLGGGENKTAQHFSAPGDDSFPLITDYVLAADVPRNGGKAIVGYVDPINDPVAQEGDKRIYARDPATGVAVVSFWLKNDGSGIMSNAAGSIELQAGGTVVINGVTIDTTGNITTPAGITADTVNADAIEADTSLKVLTLELAGHTHLAGTPPGNTGPNQ